jgi:ATP-dependent Clp protease ATP-binding subunit ClpA
VFERFTPRARQVVVLAQEEAQLLRHNYLGTEHILLGLLREEEGIAARVLGSLDVAVDRVRAQVVRLVGSLDESAPGQLPFTPRAKKALQLSLREALSLGHHYIGTEHLLLGLLREGEGVAIRVLMDLGAGPEKIRSQVLQQMEAAVGPVEAAPPTGTEITRYLTYDVARRAVLIAADAAASEGRPVDPGDLIIALAKVDDAAGEALERHVSIDALAASFDEVRKSKGGWK